MSNLPLNIDLQQIFLHLLNFTILLAGLYFLLYEPVKKFMNKRTAYYEDLDRQAKEKMEEARRVRRSYEERLMEAEEEIRQRGEEVQKSAAAQAQAQIQDAAEEAAHILAKAQAEARAERERMLNEVRGQISDMVAMATERLVLDSTSTAYDQFLAAAGEDD
ncbi:MAG: ATP synthase F0 subunit B [Oscillospiraceae bacterium]|nr:ATP synthase F0 subunit B [Oscillospiraceae bacterium]